MNEINPGGNDLSSRPIDIANLADNPGWNAQLNYEDPTERQHRLEQQAADNNHKRLRATFLFSFALLVIASVLVLSTVAIVKPEVSKENKKWATTIVGSITTGLVGFVTGKATS